MAPVLSMGLAKQCGTPPIYQEFLVKCGKGGGGKEIKGKESIRVVVGLILLLVSLFLVVFYMHLKNS